MQLLVTHCLTNENSSKLKVQINYIVHWFSGLNFLDNKIPDHLKDHLSCTLSEHTEHNYHSIRSNLAICSTSATHISNYFYVLKKNHMLYVQISLENVS